MRLTRWFRTMLNAPLFTLTVFALVCAVVAINVTAFGAIHTLRWKSLPYATDDGLAWLRIDLRKIGDKTGIGDDLRRSVAEDRAHFAAVAGFSKARRATLDEEDRSWHLARVTADFNGALGVAAALGRSVAEDDAHAGNDHVLVISDSIWRTRFNADPHIVGRSVRFGDRTDIIIGVMPRGFAFPDTTVDAWRPYVPPVGQPPGSDIGELDVVARLAGGTSLLQARAALDRMLDGGKHLPGILASLDAVAAAEPWRAHFFAEHGQALSLLQIAGLLLLVTVAANLINLQLDRLLGRAREFDVRRALGASERDIALNAIADSMLPVLAGVAAGLLLTVPGTQLLERRGLLPEGLPISASFDATALACGAAIALVALATALLAVRLTRAHAGLSARAGVTGLGRARPTLLIGQIMLTTALLGGAGLLLRSAVNVVRVDRGFDAQGVLMTGIDISGRAQAADYNPGTDASLQSAIDDVRTQAASLPGVQHVALANITPFSGGEAFELVRVPGQAEAQQVRMRQVTPGYFATLGIGLVNGRDFAADDIRDSAYPVVVDERYVQRFLRDVNPLTATIGTGSPDGATNFAVSPIVGVVHDAKHAALDEAADMPTMYIPSHVQAAMFILLVRTAGDPAGLAEQVRRLVRARIPDAAIAFNQPLGQRVEQSLGARRALLEALGGFALLTLLLAGLGLAAVLSFAIRRRTSELGVRMALGATPARIRALVMRQGGMLIVIGAVLGLGGGLLLARLLTDRLYGVAVTDPATWATAVVLVALVAAFACWLPARRAANTDPVVALRNE